jgi:hypothetical protein
MSLYLPWLDKKLLPETSPAQLAPNPKASTAKWPKLPKKTNFKKNLQYPQNIEKPNVLIERLNTPQKSKQIYHRNLHLIAPFDDVSRRMIQLWYSVLI